MSPMRMYELPMHAVLKRDQRQLIGRSCVVFELIAETPQPYLAS